MSTLAQEKSIDDDLTNHAPLEFLPPSRFSTPARDFTPKVWDARTDLMLPAFSPSQTPSWKTSGQTSQKDGNVTSIPEIKTQTTDDSYFDQRYDISGKQGLAYNTEGVDESLSEGSNGESEIEDEHHNVSSRQTAYTGQDGIARERIAYHEGDTHPSFGYDAAYRLRSPTTGGDDHQNEFLRHIAVAHMLEGKKEEEQNFMASDFAKEAVEERSRGARYSVYLLY